MALVRMGMRAVLMARPTLLTGCIVLAAAGGSLVAQQTAATPGVAKSQATTASTATVAADVPAAQRRLGFYAVPPKVEFDVVSFKHCGPDQRGSNKIDMPLDSDYIAYHCVTIGHLIYFAYVNSISHYNVPRGYADWVDSDRYEFIAKVAPEDIPAWKLLTLDERRVVTRALLADVVKLKMRLDNELQPVYLLQVGKGGPKLKPYKPGEEQKLPNGQVQQGRVIDYMGLYEYGQQQSTGDIVEALTAHMDRMVLDRTGLTGQYNFVLPTILGNAMTPYQRMTEDGPSITEGLADLGLRLQPTKVPVEQLVVDHVEPPSVD